MGKKRVIQKGAAEPAEIRRADAIPAESGGRRRAARGVAHVRATYNNTMITLADEKGNAIAWSSAGALGFSGAKKATPFAAARVAEIVAERAKKVGVTDIAVLVSGVGSGRDSSVRSLANHGLNILSIRDITPIPHNGPRPKKVRRV